MPTPLRLFLTIRGLMALVLTCALLCAFGIVAKDFRWSRRTDCRMYCSSHIRRFGLALLQYQNDHGSFPPAYVADAQGKPLYSWRVLVLPYMDCKDLYHAFNFSQAWDGPDNLQISQTRVIAFRCPESPVWSTTPLTNYVAVTGPGTAFPGPGVSTSAADLRDGSSRTILVAEVADTAISWASPRDFDVRTMSFRVNDPTKPSISGTHAGGVHAGGARVMMMDGTVHFLGDTMRPRTIKSLITIGGGETIPASEFAP